MNHGPEFDNRPDPVLGKLLREHLEGPDVPAFLARLRTAYPQDHPDVVAARREAQENLRHSEKLEKASRAG